MGEGFSVLLNHGLLCVYIIMFCSCHSDRLFVDQVKWKEPLILSLDFDK